MRIFYAFPLPEEVADWLYKISLALREKLAGGKVTPKENLHITAAFVGNVNEIKTDILSQILREVAANNTASTLSTCPPTRLRGALDLQQNQGGRRALQNQFGLDAAARAKGLQCRKALYSARDAYPPPRLQAVLCRVEKPSGLSIRFLHGGQNLAPGKQNGRRVSALHNLKNRKTRIPFLQIKNRPFQRTVFLR